jgi:hypothetical protein
MKWYDYLKSTKSITSEEDVADSIALIVIMVLLYMVVFL